MSSLIHSTTVIGLTVNGQTAIGSDGQVTVQNAIMKHGARKVRKLYNDTVLAGFAGTAADAFTLFERFEERVQEYRGNLLRAAVELAKQWRTDKYLRNLEALLAVLNKEQALVISGNGDVIEPDDGIVAIGSGGNYALVAARMLRSHTDLPAREIVRQSLEAASDICIYTNKHLTIEEL
ncbi:MAG: ATP-dependent protease subunit HslV [Ignavibacteriae bacterium]|nr:ATP-dependent protease subunit HslV [Ignavibacteria bacterium]MBI3364330.1 ATP-dependent protease subunit HslV [Ignavibacteriota bacterium]